MAWENSRNYVTSPLVFPRNDIWKTSAESFWSVPNNHSNSRLFSQVDIKSGIYWFEEEPRVLLSNIVRKEKFLFGIPFNIKMNQESAWYHFEGSRQSWKSLVPRPYTARSMRLESLRVCLGCVTEIHRPRRPGKTLHGGQAITLITGGPSSTRDFISRNP